MMEITPLYRMQVENHEQNDQGSPTSRKGFQAHETGGRGGGGSGGV